MNSLRWGSWSIHILLLFSGLTWITGKNNGFPFLDILGYLKNTHKNPKFGKVRKVPTREFPAKFPDWDLSHSSKFGILWVFFKYPKMSKNGNLLFFPVNIFYYYGQNCQSSSQYSEQVNSPFNRHWSQHCPLSQTKVKNAESMRSDVFQGVHHVTKLVLTGHYINFCQSVCKLVELEKGLVR